MEKSGKETYEDIIALPYPHPSRHVPMPMQERAAQFAPFAALTGFENVIQETGRLTEAWGERTESSDQMLDEALRCVSRRIGEKPMVRVLWFRPDEKKSGGAYVYATGRLKKIDCEAQYLQLTDGRRIALEQVVQLLEVQEEDASCGLR